MTKAARVGEGLGIVVVLGSLGIISVVAFRYKSLLPAPKLTQSAVRDTAAFGAGGAPTYLQGGTLVTTPNDVLAVAGPRVGGDLRRWLEEWETGDAMGSPRRLSGDRLDAMLRTSRLSSGELASLGRSVFFVEVGDTQDMLPSVRSNSHAFLVAAVRAAAIEMSAEHDSVSPSERDRVLSSLVDPLRYFCDWSALHQLCDLDIRVAPRGSRHAYFAELFRGVANLNLGHIRDAQQQFGALAISLDKGDYSTAEGFDSAWQRAELEYLSAVAAKSAGDRAAYMRYLEEQLSADHPFLPKQTLLETMERDYAAEGHQADALRILRQLYPG